MFYVKDTYTRYNIIFTNISLAVCFLKVDAWSSIVDHYLLTPKQLEEFGSEVRCELLYVMGI